MSKPAWNPTTNQFEMDGDCERTTWQLKIWLIIQLKQPVNNGWFSGTRYYNPQSNLGFACWVVGKKINK